MLKAFFFGFDQENLHLRLDPADECLGYNGNFYEARIHLMGRVERQVRFPLAFSQATVNHYQMMALNQGNEWEEMAVLDAVRVGSIAEIAIPFAKLEVSPGQPVWFVVHIMKGEIEEDRYPKNGRVLITVPDENYNSINWSV